jgi:hypothetical protein
MSQDGQLVLATPGPNSQTPLTYETNQTSTIIITPAINSYPIPVQTNFYNDLTIQNRLFTQIDLSFTNPLVILGDLTVSGRLNANILNTPVNPTAIIGGVYSSNYIGDVSFTTGSRLFVAGDVTFASTSRLFVSGDISASGRLFLGGDASLAGRLFIGSASTFIADISLNSN